MATLETSSLDYNNINRKQYKKKRRFKKSHQLWRRCLRWLVWGIVWWGGAVTVGNIHLDSVKMYIIITVLIAIFVSLGENKNKENSEEGNSVENEESPVINPLNSKINNDTRKEENNNNNTNIVEGSSNDSQSALSMQRRHAIFTALKSIGTPQAIRAIHDDELRENIMNSSINDTNCCCGSGLRFLKCCRIIQDELQHCGL